MNSTDENPAAAVPGASPDGADSARAAPEAPAPDEPLSPGAAGTGKDAPRPSSREAATAHGPGPSIAAGVRDAAAAAAHTVAPVARKAAAGFADWLVSIGWGKFFLLSVLLLIFSGIAFSLFFSRTHSAHPIDQGEISVNVHVLPLANGDLQIQSSGAHPKNIVVHPGRSRERGSGKAGTKAGGDDVLLQIEGDGDEKNPEVRIDRQGVRILAEDEGGKASVVIDHNGVRIEKLAPHAAKKAGSDSGKGADAVPGSEASSSAGAGAPESPASAARPVGPADPEKVAEAVEAARDQIETIVQEDVNDKLEQFQLGNRAERGNWLATLAGLAIVVSIILKVVLGSKSKAESQARQASATAAQEGLKRQLAEAQLKMMQAQVEPHFLFNTLASVDYLIETDPARASRMQKNLIQYLRAALPQMREGTSSLGREIQQCRSYLEILKVRMDERLQFSINVPQGLQSAAFPPMMLQTLVENAIKHGLEPKPQGGSLSLSAVIANGALQVAVADSGLGFGAAQRGGTGVGLTNVRERLQALFGSAARLQIEANADGGTIATVIVPYRVDPYAASGAAGGVDPASAAMAGAAGAAG
jgi:hypothetical protein